MGRYQRRKNATATTSPGQPRLPGDRLNPRLSQRVTEVNRLVDAGERDTWPGDLTSTQALAIDVLSRYPGPWSIAFQHDNTRAGEFWRVVADTVFGAGRWTKALRPVPNRPAAPPDHFIESSFIESSG